MLLVLLLLLLHQVKKKKKEEAFSCKAPLPASVTPRQQLLIHFIALLANQPPLLMKQIVVLVAVRWQETPLSAAVFKLSTMKKGNILEVKHIQIIKQNQVCKFSSLQYLLWFNMQKERKREKVLSMCEKNSENLLIAFLFAYQMKGDGNSERG